MIQITLIYIFFSLGSIGHALPENSQCNKMGQYTRETKLMQDLGLKVMDLTEDEKASLHVSNGIKVVEIRNGKTKHIMQMQVGFIILKANNVPINSCNQFHELLSTQRECSVMLEGIYPDSPTICYYAFELD